MNNVNDIVGTMATQKGGLTSHGGTVQLPWLVKAIVTILGIALTVLVLSRVAVIKICKKILH